MPSDALVRVKVGDVTESQLEKTQAGTDRMARMRAAAATAERLDPTEKARRNPKSRSLAINAKCYDCEGRDSDPCVNWRIGNCKVPRCPLYPVRPYQHLHGTPTPPSLVGTPHES
jgi:hypothetical protein